VSPLVDATIARVRFPGWPQPVLQDIQLQVEPGELVVVCGPVAAGKTVLCHSLSGAIPAFFQADLEGKVTVGGVDLARAKLPSLAGLVGYMTQEPQTQLFSGTVEEDVAFGPCNLGLPRDEVRRRVAESLAFVGLSGFEQRSPGTLSGGEAQRVVLAAVLALRPRLLVLDQPTAELDPRGRRAVLACLQRLRHEHDVAVVMVSDRPEELRSHATRFLQLEGGRPAVYIGRPASSFGRRWRAPDPGDEVVALDGCTHAYPDSRTGCRDVDLTLRQGELVALLGVNGSGKTTVAKHCNGLLRPTAGTVRLFGREAAPGRLEAGRRVGFLFQNPDHQLLADSVTQEVAFTLRLQRLAPDQIPARVEQTLGLVGLAALGDEHPHKLSRGQRQLLAVASVLAGHQDVLVADEPTSGLGWAEAERVMQLLAGQVDDGRTVLLVTHDLELALAHATRVVVMREQAVVCDFPRAELPRHLDALAAAGLDVPAERPPSFEVTRGFDSRTGGRRPAFVPAGR
jgi:energy-coupling factor transporter ATP-binding protein EcfA2